MLGELVKEVEQGTYEYNRLVGRIFEVFVGHIMLYETWGYLSFIHRFLDHPNFGGLTSGRRPLQLSA
jgi:hypothetical protein